MAVQATPPGSPKVTPPPKAQPAPPTPATSMTPTQWADMVLSDLSGSGVQVDPTTTTDILSWMPAEEPSGSWWGGFGTASDPTRINPLNAGDIGKFGYAGNANTGDILSGGLGGYPTLTDAASAEADMIQKDFPGILNALKSNESGNAWGQALTSAGYAGSGYGGNSTQFNALNAQQELTAPTVQNANAVGSNNSTEQSIADLLGGQLTNSELQQLAQTQSLEQQLALTPAEYQNQLSILQQNYGYSQQQFGVQQANLNLSTTELAQQGAYEKAMYGYQQQQNTLSGQNIQAAIQNILQNFGYQQTQTQSGFAGSGLTNTGTAKLTTQEQATAEQYALFQQKQSQASLGLTEKQQAEQYGYTQQQLSNGMTSLKNQQASLGISEAQAQAQYNNAVQQLGLGNVMNGLQLEQQIAIMAGGGYSPMSSMMGQLAQLLPQINGAFTNASQTGSGG